MAESEEDMTTYLLPTVFTGKLPIEYRIGEIVEELNFNEDRWNECSEGIHFFINRQEAVEY